MSELTLPEDTLAFIKALASEPRMKILLLFTDGQERTVNEIRDAIDLSQSNTSEHLNLMKRAGILDSNKQGKEVYYRPDRQKILQHLETVGALLRDCCAL